MRHGAILIASGLVWLAPCAARAAACASGAGAEFIPGADAVGVPTNAVLYARYEANVRHAGETVQLVRQGGPDVGGLVPGQSEFVAAESALRFVPAEPLSPGTRYQVTWPVLGLLPGVSGRPGRARTFAFTTGGGPDQQAPSFEGLRVLDWDWENRRDPCTGRLEDRYVFSLSPGAAADDGGRDSLSLLVFETEGPGTAGEPRLVSVAPLPAAGRALRVPRNVAAGHGRLCFLALVRDATGKVSSGAGAPLCTTTVALPYFDGCAMGGAGTASPGRGGSPVLVPGCLLALLIGARRRR